MPIAEAIRESLTRSSWIRKMFEEGIKLKAEFGADKVFDFSLGNPDIEPPKEFHETLVALLAKNTKGMHAYMPNAGYAHVREAIAKKVSRDHAFKVDAEHVIMTTGAAGGLNVVMKTILNPGDEVIVPIPYFAEYSFYVDNHGGVLRPVPSNPDFSLNVDSIAAVLGPKTAAVIINSPNNPSGKIYRKKEIHDLAALLAAHGKKTGRYPLLIADEPYRDIVYDGRTVTPVLDAYPETVVVSSYSKSLSLPGERIGYIAVSGKCSADSELLSGMIMANRILGFVNAPALMQRAVAELTELTIDITRYADRRVMLMENLKAANIEFSEPEGAFYIFCKAPGGDDIKFCMHLKEFRVLGVPGTGFGCPGWFRLCYAIPEPSIEGSKTAFVSAMQAWKAKK